MTCSVSYLKTHRKKKSRQLDWESDKKQKRLKCNDAENLIGENCEIKIKQEQEEPDDERNSISPSRDDYSHVYSPRQNLSSFNIEFKKKKKKHRKASMEFAVLLRCNR